MTNNVTSSQYDTEGYKILLDLGFMIECEEESKTNIVARN